MAGPRKSATPVLTGATRQVALLRGINVGRAKRISMAELRSLVENIGYGTGRPC